MHKSSKTVTTLSVLFLSLVFYGMSVCDPIPDFDLYLGKDNVGIQIQIDSADWTCDVTVTNYSDTTAYIYPRILATVSTSRATGIKHLLLHNFDNHSSIIFPVRLTPILPDSSFTLSVDMEFVRGLVDRFDTLYDGNLVTHLMMDFRDFEIKEDSLGHRTIRCNEYQYYSKKTSFDFELK